MADLVKMDLYRLFRSKGFLINTILIAVATIIAKFVSYGFILLVKKLGQDAEELEGIFEDLKGTPISSLISSPFAFSLLMVVVFISIINFSYSDISGGFIKNIAGQLPRRGYSVISKFIVIAIHNLFFMVIALLFSIIGEAVIYGVRIDSDTASSIGTFFLKWMLMQAVSAIILYITTGLKNKTFASVVAVFLGMGFISAVYLGLNLAIAKLFHANIDLSQYAPSQLLQASRVAVTNGIVVSVVVSAVFLGLSVWSFNRHDIK